MKKSTAVPGYSLIVFSMLALFCAKQDKEEQEVLGRYLKLRHDAEAFVPAIGTYGGTLTLPSWGEPQSLNPVTSPEPLAGQLYALMYEGLVRINGVTGEPEPGLARAWDVSADGRTWTFHIRDGLVWSDSTPLTTDDIVFTYTDIVLNDSIRPNNLKSLFCPGDSSISVEARDSTTVVFTLSRPLGMFLNRLSIGIMPRHRLLRFVSDRSYAFPLLPKTPADSIVGSGPFVVRTYVPSRRIILLRNPCYWRRDAAGNALPYIDSLVFTLSSGPNTDLFAFREGRTDFLTARGRDCLSLKENEALGNYTVHLLGPADDAYCLILNRTRCPDSSTQNSGAGLAKQNWFRNPAFSKAIAHVLDRESMIRDVFDGMAHLAWSPVNRLDPLYNNEILRYSHNLDKAKKILAREGFRDSDGNGLLEDCSGNPVCFSIATNGDNMSRVRISRIIAADLRALGFDVSVAEEPMETLRRRLLDSPYAWDAAVVSLPGTSSPHLAYAVWHSRGSSHFWDRCPLDTPDFWQAELDGLLDKGLYLTDTTNLRGIIYRWQVLVSENLPVIYTVSPERIVCLSNRFRNVNPSPFGGVLHNIEELFVDTPADGGR